MDEKDGLAWDEIKVWRKAQRQALVSRRAATAESGRKAWNDRITARLIAAFAMPAEAVVG